MSIRFEDFEEFVQKTKQFKKTYYILVEGEVTETYDSETGKAYFMFDLDVFVTDEVPLDVLTELIESFEILYSKPCFEFWLLLHKDGKEISCKKSSFIGDVMYLTSEEIRGYLTSHEHETQMVSNKRILPSGKDLIEKNSSVAIGIANEIINSIDPNFLQMNKENYQKILSCKENITNIQTLLMEIQRKL